MRRIGILLSALILLLVSHVNAWSMAGEHNPKFPAVQQPHWPGETVTDADKLVPKPGEVRNIADVINSRKFVYGYWVNWHTDRFFYSGDTQAFNEFLALYSKVPETPHVLVIHVGPALTGNFTDPKKDNIPFDWEVDISFDAMASADSKPSPDQYTPGTDKYPAVMHLWLGRNVELRKIIVPANVTAVDGGEIGKFIKEHEGEEPSK